MGMFLLHITTTVPHNIILAGHGYPRYSCESAMQLKPILQYIKQNAIRTNYHAGFICT